ncbi:MAG: hypothetical protein HOP29_11935 [Phycisphaerales bacterium]|nr:hypothetical protein [Phycisphaerales bacterium]
MTRESSRKYGVMTVQGDDHDRQFWTALKLLDEAGKDSNAGRAEADRLDAPSVDQAWVRKFGPLGVVQVRFNANDEAFRYLCSRKASARALQELRTFNPKKYGTRPHPLEEPAPLIVVNEAPPPSVLDPSVTKQFWSGRSSIDTRAGSASAGEGPDRRLQRFAAILAAVPGLELSQYDSVRVNRQVDRAASPQLVQRFAILDHFRRGPYWLEDCVKHAMTTHHRGPDQEGADLSNRSENRYKTYPFSLDSWEPQQTELFLQQLVDLGQWVPESKIEQGYKYLYLLAHCSEDQKLFSDLSHFLEFDAMNPQRLPIVQAAFRGMGAQSVVMLAALAPEQPAEEINRRLDNWLEGRGNGVAAYSWRPGDARFRVHEARVSNSEQPPSVKRNSGHGYVCLRVRHFEDKAGLLFGLCNQIDHICRQSAALDKYPSFYLVDGQCRNEEDGTKSFGCTMGVVVPESCVQALMTGLPDYLEEKKWTGDIKGAKLWIEGGTF